MALLKGLPIIIGPVLVIFIFSYYVTLDEFFAVFHSASPVLLILSYLFNLLLLFIKAHRLHVFLKKSNITFDFFYTLKLFATANLLGHVSNFLVSDITNAGIMMFKQEKRLRITSIFILNRVCDLTAALLIVAVTFSLNYPVISTFANFSFRPFLFFVFSLALAVPLTVHYRRQFLAAYRDIRELLREAIVIYLTYLIVICVFLALSAWCETRTLHLYLPISFVLFAYTLGSLISVLPISIAGIGTRDMLFIYLFGLVHVPAAIALTLSFLGFIIIPPISLTTLFLIAWIGGHYADRHNH